MTLTVNEKEFHGEVRDVDDRLIVVGKDGQPLGGAGTPGAPNIVELSDGAAVYTATKTGQLPTSLVGGRLSTDGSGVTQPISAVTLPLPSTAATDRTTAAGPSSVELSDGAAFYTAAKTGQLPTALDGSGFLKVHEQGTSDVSDRTARLLGHVTVDTAPAVTGTVTANAGTGTFTTDPTDRTGRLLGHTTVDSLADRATVNNNTYNTALVHDNQVRRLLEQLLIETQELKAIMAHHFQQGVGRLDFESSTEVLASASRR